MAVCTDTPHCTQCGACAKNKAPFTLSSTGDFSLIYSCQMSVNIFLPAERMSSFCPTVYMWKTCSKSGWGPKRGHDIIVSLVLSFYITGNKTDFSLYMLKFWLR